MIGGLLVSRLFLSLGIIIFGINGIWGIPPRHWLRNKWWLMGATWIGMYAASWFWSTDKAMWEALLQLKLPILLLPLAFAFLPPCSTKHLGVLTVGIAVMLLAGAGYSLSFLVRDYAHYVQEYNVSHVLPTPVYKDYICFSTTCSLFIIWCFCIFPKMQQKWIRALIIATIIILAVYIHILASKSGLVAFYLFILCWGVYIAFSKRSIAGMALVVAIPFCLAFAMEYIPTLHERKEHIVYSFYVFRAHDTEHAGHLGDLSRISSYDISLKLIRQNPWIGVGSGDMHTVMDSGYNKWYPYITNDENKLIPHNQFLAVTLACGIPAGLVFFAWVFMPLFSLRKNRESAFFFIVWLILLVQLMIEPFLEGQFGVFIYVFFLLMFWRLLPTTKNNRPD